MKRALILRKVIVAVMALVLALPAIAMEEPTYSVFKEGSPQQKKFASIRKLIQDKRIPDKEIIKAINENSRTVIFANPNGMTLLMFAAQEGRPLVVDHILSAGNKLGINPSQAVGRLNVAGETALIFAAKNGKTAIVAKLLSANPPEYTVRLARNAATNPEIVALIAQKLGGNVQPESAPVSEEENDCCVCLEGLIQKDGNIVSIGKCGHQIHKKCLQQLKEKHFTECPLCRGKI